MTAEQLSDFREATLRASTFLRSFREVEGFHSVHCKIGNPVPALTYHMTAAAARHEFGADGWDYSEIFNESSRDFAMSGHCVRLICKH